VADFGARQARVRSVLRAAKILQDPREGAGQSLRRSLLTTTFLSPQNIELCLSRCLETEPEPEHVAALVTSTPEAPAAHVLLSANVFVAALRAIAIGVASASRVFVRASRRDPALAQALHGLVPDLFQLVPALAPQPQDHVWAYGADETLDSVQQSLPRGVWFHPHGAGFGVVVLDVTAPYDVRAIALDTALFDQRGCLSPRVVCVIGSEAAAREVARALAEQLTILEQELPPGPRTPETLAEQRRERDAAAYAFELEHAGSGWVTVGPRFMLPPAARCLHVMPVEDVSATLQPLAAHVTNIGCNSRKLSDDLRAVFPAARVVGLGEMQRPVLDGPVDLRHGTAGRLILG